MGQRAAAVAVDAAHTVEYPEALCARMSKQTVLLCMMCVAAAVQQRDDPAHLDREQPG